MDEYVPIQYIGLKCGSGGVKALSLNKSSSLKIELQDSPKCCVRLINRTDAVMQPVFFGDFSQYTHGILKSGFGNWMKHVARTGILLALYPQLCTLCLWLIFQPN